jgi:hypothetical protein
MGAVYRQKQKMDSRSFNLSITNLFIGLLKGHRFLWPYSDCVMQLEYNVMATEATLVTPTGKAVTPELITASILCKHVIQTEWTTLLELNQRKREQISKLLEINANSLADKINFPDLSISTVSTLLVVLQKVVKKYAELISNENESRLMLCGFNYDDSQSTFHLIWHIGHIQDAIFSSLLKKNISVDRIPSEYTYHLIDELEDKSKILKLVIDELVAFGFRGRNHFTPEEIALAIYGSPEMWNTLSLEKKHLIIRNVNSVFRHFRKEIAKNSIVKSGTDESISWRINTSPMQLGKLSRTYLEANMVDGRINIENGMLSDEI